MIIYYGRGVYQVSDLVMQGIKKKMMSLYGLGIQLRALILQILVARYYVKVLLVKSEFGG